MPRAVKSEILQIVRSLDWSKQHVRWALLGLAAFASALWISPSAAGWLAFAAPALILVAAIASVPSGSPASAGDAARASEGRAGQGMAAPPMWRQILEALSDPAIVLDHRRHVVAANTAALTIFPASTGRHIAQVSRAPELLTAVDRAARTLASEAFELRTIVPVERHLLGTVTALRPAEDGDAKAAYMLVLQDRTEVERLSQMRADFVANASHELRTPLAALKGFVETLQGAAKDDARARDNFLDIMQGEAARMSRLIDDLLSLSRIEMHEHIPPTALVDFAALVANAVASLRPLAARAEVALEFAAPADGIHVRGDRDELMQIAQNLIQNAIKYGRKGGRAEIRLAASGGKVHLNVIDDGIGIAPEHLPRLTERFYRVSAKSSRERGGTGLGLAIIKHIVNRHRGELRIASELGRGSTFTVVLPSADAAGR